MTAAPSPITPDPITPCPIDEDAAWEAFARRDRAADGRFVVAVTTTGIYCKPSCPARRPRPENVRFFDEGAAAASGDAARSAARTAPAAAPETSAKGGFEVR